MAASVEIKTTNEYLAWFSDRTAAYRPIINDQLISSNNINLKNKYAQEE